METNTSLAYSKNHRLQNTLVGQSPKGGRPDFADCATTAPSRAFFQQGQSPPSYPLSQLFEIGDDIVNLLRIFQTWKSHFGTGYLGPLYSRKRAQLCAD